MICVHDYRFMTWDVRCNCSTYMHRSSVPNHVYIVLLYNVVLYIPPTDSPFREGESIVINGWNFLVRINPDKLLISSVFS